MLDLQPVVVCNHKLTEHSTIFYVGKEKITLLEHREKVTAVLEMCDNIRTVSEIIKLLSNKVTKEEVLEIIEWLDSENIIIDATNLYQYQHNLSRYPDCYVANLELFLNDSVNVKESKATGIQLPVNNTSLLDIMSIRKSTRVFSDKEVPVELIGGLLSAMTQVRKNKTYASAGSIYPIKLYLHFFSQNGSIPAGTYLFDEFSLTLVEQQQIQTEVLMYALDNEFDLTKAGIIFVTANLNKHTQKYSNRGYNYTVMNIGASCSNAYLYCAENNLSICQYGGFDSLILKSELALHKDNEVMAVLRFGYEGVELNDEIDRLNRQICYLSQTLSNESNLKVNLRPLEFAGVPMGYWATSTRFRLSNGDEAGGNGVSYSATLSKLKSHAEILERLASGRYKSDVICPANSLNSWLDPRVEFPLHPNFVEKFNLRQFDEKQDQEWIIGKRLKSQQKVFVPTDCVFYPLPCDYHMCFGVTSNGVAAGQTYEGAVHSALCELIERDAIMVSWYSQQSVRKVEERLLDPYLQNKIEYWKKQNRKLEFFDLSIDTIPVILATVSGQDYPMFVKGSSANPNFLKACHKALQEVEITTHSLVHSYKLQKMKPKEVLEVDDHGRLYYFPEYQNHLWQFQKPIITSTIPTTQEKFNYLDPIVITLHEPQDELDLWVVRVIDETFLQITFGYATEHYNHHRLADLGLKWALPYPATPHYIA